MLSYTVRCTHCLQRPLTHFHSLNPIARSEKAGLASLAPRLFGPALSPNVLPAQTTSSTHQQQPFVHSHCGTQVLHQRDKLTSCIHIRQPPRRHLALILMKDSSKFVTVNPHFLFIKCALCETAVSYDVSTGGALHGRACVPVMLFRRSCHCNWWRLAEEYSSSGLAACSW